MRPADLPLEPGERFRIGSIIQQIAATRSLTLFDENKLSLSDQQSKYLFEHAAHLHTWVAHGTPDCGFAEQ